MKKKIARIQRWLDRFSVACDKARWDSAIVEADCMSAEIREIRDDLCEMLEDGNSGKQGLFTRSTVAMSIKSIGIAMFIVLASTIPLAVEADKAVNAASLSSPVENKQGYLTWVTKEEEELIQILRTDLSGNKMSVYPAVKKISVPLKTIASIPKDKQPKPENLTGNNNLKNKAGSDISAEDLMVLVQIGEKAIRGGDPAIKVIE